MDILSRFDDKRAARRFQELLAKLYRVISKTPAMGSLRYSDAYRHPALRYCSMHPFRYLLFEVEREDQVEIVRLLPDMIDIPAHLRDLDMR